MPLWRPDTAFWDVSNSGRDKCIFEIAGNFSGGEGDNGSSNMLWGNFEAAWPLMTTPDAALNGDAALPCDTCQYRRALPGRAREVGGLRALLWSMRHTFTHTQAMPAEHAHAAVEKHVFVCANADCAARGSAWMPRYIVWRTWRLTSPPASTTSTRSSQSSD